MQIHLVSPSGYIHHRSFYPQMEALRESTLGLRDDKNLLLAAHIYPEHLLREKAIPDDWIIYNCEQIGSGFAMNPAYLELLRTHETWDYSWRNIEALKAEGVSARYCGVGYSPCLTKPEIINACPTAQDIDVLFYGSLNDRRKIVLQELNEKCRVQVAFGFYGAALDALIARAKIVLNMHFYDTAIHEITRTSYLMANKKCVVTEVGKDTALEEPYKDAMVFCEYEKLADRCMAYLAHPLLRATKAENGFKMFSAKGQREMVEVALA
jgi:hypothetical protein